MALRTAHCPVISVAEEGVLEPHIRHLGRIDLLGHDVRSLHLIIMTFAAGRLVSEDHLLSRFHAVAIEELLRSRNLGLNFLAGLFLIGS